MNDHDVSVERDGDHTLYQSPRTSCESETGSLSVRQGGGDSDDSELYDTDVESEANKPTTPGTYCVAVFLVACLVLV